jgi:hypothetical protein
MLYERGIVASFSLGTPKRGRTHFSRQGFAYYISPIQAGGGLDGYHFYIRQSRDMKGGVEIGPGINCSEASVIFFRMS